MLPWLGLGKRYLDLSFKARSGVRLRIVERPGKWMHPSERGAILADMKTVVSRSIQDGGLAYGVLTGDKDRWDNCILTLIYAPEDGRPVAFNALSIMACVLRGKPVEVVHLGLVMIDPTSRARGLSAVLYGLTCFLILARRQMRPLWVSNVTQVPAVYGMVCENFANVYPDVREGARRSFDHLALAREIMEKHRGVFGVAKEAGFDEARFVITNSYTGGSDNLKKAYDATAKHRSDEFNEACRSTLDYDRGDDFLQLAQFNVAAAKRYFVGSTPHVSPAVLRSRFAFLFLESWLLPLVHWFTPSRPMGELRPWTS